MAAAESLLSRIRPDLRRLDVTAQTPRLEDIDSVAALETWVLTLIGDYASTAHGTARPAEVSYTIHRLPCGGWIGSVNERGREPRRLGLVDHADDRDLGGQELARSMFRDALANGVGVGPEDELIEVVSREFAQDLLRPMRSGQDANFSAEFVRRWIQNRRRNRQASA